jgi:molybdate transport system ATP-binding protein
MLDIALIRKQGQFSVHAFFQGPSTGVTALFGPSGAGKTSIVSMVAGLLRPDAGRIVVNDQCLFDSARGTALAPEERRIGYVFQDGRLFPHLTVRSNLTYGMGRTRVSRRFVRLEEVVDLLGIEPLLSRRPAKLSGGEKQRVAIGRALLTSPTLLLMDEPLASLDEARKAEVLPFVMRLSQRFEIPILYVSHDLEEIIRLAEYLVILESGQVAAAGTIAELAAHADFYDPDSPPNVQSLRAAIFQKRAECLNSFCQPEKKKALRPLT